MVYEVIVKSLAEQDITEAIEWYAEHTLQLAEELTESIEDCLTSIEEHPLQYQKRYGEARVAFTRKFPYDIYYTIEEQTIFIHAVLHSKRNPKTSIDRL